MSIALFDEPPRVSIKPERKAGRHGLLMGVVYDHSMSPRTLTGLVVTEDGDMEMIDARYLVVDWRFDVSRNMWIDTNAPESDQ